MSSNPATALRLHIAGALRIENGEGSAFDNLSRRAQAALVYLSLQPDMRCERSYLADLLWSDRSQDQARASLRQELSVLRRVLPEGLIDANRQHVWMNPARVTVVDGPGEPLQGFDLPSEGFEDWLRDLRLARDDQPSRDATQDASVFERPAVLLLAFEALNDSPETRMIAAGLSEDLRTTLCYWRWFPVIGPDAVGWKTAKDCDLRDVAASVEAAYAVTGTLGHIGQQVRISVALTDARSGRSLWSQSFDGAIEDIFQFQDDVSRAIVGHIEPEISRAEAARITRARPDAIAPWQMLAMADDIDRHSVEGYGTPEDNFEQARLMEKALEIAPDFAPAYARLGRIQFRCALLSWVDDTDAAFAKSLEYTGKALRLDPDSWEAHAYSGLARIFGTREYEAGIFHGSEAVRLNPSAPLALHAAGCGLEWSGQPQEALGHLDLIPRLNPRYPGRAAVLGQVASCQLFLNNEPAATEASRQLFAIAPDYARGLQRCVSTFGYFGKLDEARRALVRLRQLQPRFDETYVRETYPYARPEDLEMMIEGFRRAGAFAT